MRDISILNETHVQSLTARVSISSTSLELHSVCSESPLWKEWLCKIAAMRVCITYESAEDAKEMDKSTLQFQVRTGDTVILDYTNGSTDIYGRCANIAPPVLIEKLRSLDRCNALEEVSIDIMNPKTADLELEIRQDWADEIPLTSNNGIYTHAMVKAEYCHPMCILTMDEVSRNLTPIVSDGDIDKFVKWPTDQEVKAFYTDIPQPQTEFNSEFVIDSLPSATSTTTSSTTSSTAPSATTSSTTSTAHSSTAPSATTSSTTSSTAHSSTAPSATTSTAHSSTAHSATPSIAHSSTAPSATTSSTGAILTRSISLLMCWIVL